MYGLPNHHVSHQNEEHKIPPPQQKTIKTTSQLKHDVTMISASPLPVCPSILVVNLLPDAPTPIRFNDYAPGAWS